MTGNIFNTTIYSHLVCTSQLTDTAIRSIDNPFGFGDYDGDLFFDFNMFRPYQLCWSTLIISSTDKTKSVFETILAKEAMVNPCQFIIFGEILPSIGIGPDSYLSQIPMKKQQDFLNDNFPPPQKNWGVTL